jgi:hypothetical protein
MMSEPSNPHQGAAPAPGAEVGLSSKDLAALVIDSLLRAGMVQQQHVERATKIVTEELEVRKVMGDY